MVFVFGCGVLYLIITTTVPGMAGKLLAIAAIPGFLGIFFLPKARPVLMAIGGVLLALLLLARIVRAFDGG